METTSTNPLFHKPMSIIAARNILYSNLFLGVIVWAINQWGSDQHPVLPITGLIVLLLDTLIVYGLIKLTGKGKQWPSIILLVLFVAGLLALPWTLPVYFKASLLVRVLSVLQLLLQLIALVFLFSRPSKRGSIGHKRLFVMNPPLRRCISIASPPQI